MIYPTVREAAIAALTEILPTAQEKLVEYGGVIYKRDTGGYEPSKPITSGCDGMVNLDSLLPLDPDARPDIVATFHTHVGNIPEFFAPELFSEGDVEQASWFNYEAIYMGSGATGNIYEATPTSSRWTQVCTALYGCGVGVQGETVSTVAL